MVEDRASAKRRLGVGGVIVLGIMVLAITVAIGVVRGIHPTEPVPTPSGEASSGGIAGVADDTASSNGAAVYVHVSGAVLAPGLYMLGSGDRVADAIVRAGGFADDAERSAVNLARVVVDGEQVHIPRIGESAEAATTGGGGEQAAATGGGGVVDLNTADAATLQTLPRIGPALAERIVAWRAQNGRFSSVEDLLAVSGIGEKLLESIRDRVRA